MSTLSEGIQLSKINPKFLHSNSTSHVWAFGAFAELIDNAYDPDVGASSLLIDVQKIDSMPCLILLDNGAGMDKEKLIKMLSFGYCDKGIYNRREDFKPVGLNGNGFKSGSMRLGKDALIFSRDGKSACIGFLSQTFLEAIGADSVIVPIIEYSLPDLKRSNNRQCLNNLEAILQHSIFKTEALLKGELNSLKSSVTGTKIFIFNLHRLKSGKEELDFQSDRKDIRCPDPYIADTTNLDCRPVEDTPEYKRSLREYCSILYLRPRMKIIIRGYPVKSKYISKMLYQTEQYPYKPNWMGQKDKPIKITIGFSCEKDCNENYGLMLYHKNRLMRAYERVGYQKQANERGVGVIGVVELDFITPTHNKQDFDRNENFNSIMSALAGKLNAYWNNKKETQNNNESKLPDWTWAQCDNCLLWRRLPLETDPGSLSKAWFCQMNKDAQYNRCFVDEEPDAPVDTPRRKRAIKRPNTEALLESTQGEESSTAIEPIPKRKKTAVKLSPANSKSQISSKSPKRKTPRKSPQLTVSNTSKALSQKKKIPQKSSSQNDQTNSADHNNSDDGSDDYEGTSSGSFRKPVNKSNPTGSPPLLIVSKSLFNGNKSYARIQDSSNEDQGTNHSPIELEEGQVLTRSMRNGINAAVQTDQPEPKMVCEVETQTESEILTRIGSTFHQNVHRLIRKILPEVDIGDVSDIEIIVSNMITEETPEDSEDEISENILL